MKTIRWMMVMEGGADAPPMLRSGPDVFRLARELELPYKDREHFIVLLLNTKHRMIASETVSVGILNGSLIHPREVFKAAIAASAAAIIICHNHPSGDPTPSLEDWTVTKRLREAGDLLGIPLLDHVIVTPVSFRSLRETWDQKGA